MILLKLLKAWEQRDRRYAVRKAGRITAPLSVAEQDAVRLNRKGEVALLSPSDRERALNVLDRWVAPRVAV